MSDCSNCEAKRTQVPDNVPLFFHESAMAMAERTIMRLWKTVILLVLLLVITNGAWIWYESQFVETTTTIEAEADDGGNAIANNNGMVNYNGKS